MGDVMKKTLKAASALAGLMIAGTVMTVAAQADQIKPAIVFDLGGKFDKSFNEGVANGAEKFTKETGIQYSGFETTNETQIEQAHRKYAQKGLSPIIGVGFDQGDA